MLCGLCKQIDQPGKELRYLLWELRPQVRPLRDRQVALPRAPCQLCDVLWRALVALVGERHLELFETLVVLDIEFGGVMRADLLPFDEKVRKMRLQFFLDPGATPKFGRIGGARQIAENGISSSCIELIQKWLATCNISHDKCVINNEASLLPTRVIWVGNQYSTPRLHISKHDEKGLFVALSHCWGGSSPVLTTTATLPMRVDSIPLLSLPQTFQDAIQVTRALGIEYLWIDSLCIVQDSHDDWVHEASRMGTIYESAYFTISADAAQDCNTGFLSAPARRPGVCVSVPFDNPTATSQSANGTISVREKGSLMRQLPIHGWHSENIMALAPPEPEEDTPSYLQIITGAPTSRLSTRGWVMQERILASRTLHFGKFELGWECRNCISCECCADSKRSRRGDARLKGALGKNEWPRIVKEYTWMSLTVSEDRLPALSGLVSTLAKGSRLGDEYVSGLWKSTLAQDLLWHVPSGSEKDKKGLLPRPYAPSWSWASLNAPVEYAPANPGIANSFEVVDIVCEPVGGNPYGPVTEHSYIEVSGLCVPVWYNGLLSPENSFVSIEPNLQARFQRQAGFRSQVRVYPDTEMDPRALKHRERLRFLLISDGEHSLSGLLLKKMEGHQLGDEVYERVGYACDEASAPVKVESFYTTDSDFDYEPAPADHRAWAAWEKFASKKVMKII
ncbi:HET-domain-containing protein [Westerdykella ornata]|uniref:HET-domain-containing protein n=1 Tax=Westerdykella ornata TaxID=318751 RepID=A0A6A6JC66_WESOR|nr:HET-domain-containing protein [Westerdykella ornata]KAF2273588.1 HET-domain-containing protein [Westerdykella ornata]